MPMKKWMVLMLLCCLFLLGASCPSPPRIYAQAAADGGSVRLVVYNAGGTPAKRAEIRLWLADRPGEPVWVTVCGLPAHARRVVTVPCGPETGTECRVTGVNIEA